MHLLLGICGIRDLERHSNDYNANRSKRELKWEVGCKPIKGCNQSNNEMEKEIDNKWINR